MFVSINKQLKFFSQLRRLSISVLQAEVLKNFFSFTVYPLATYRCVAGNTLPASYGLIVPAVDLLEGNSRILCE